MRPPAAPQPSPGPAHEGNHAGSPPSAVGTISSRSEDVDEATRFARRAVQQEILELEAWAALNDRDAKRDRMRFWVLKGPAIGCAAATAAFEALHLGPIVIGLGLIAAICGAVDAAYPRGELHNVHTRSVHDIRTLAHSLRNKFMQAQMRKTVEVDAPKILEEARLGRERISNYLKVVEASLGREGQPQQNAGAE